MALNVPPAMAAQAQTQGQQAQGNAAVSAFGVGPVRLPLIVVGLVLVWRFDRSVLRRVKGGSCDKGMAGA